MDGPPIARSGRLFGGGEFTLLHLHGAPAILPGSIVGGGGRSPATRPSQQPFALSRPEEWGVQKEASWGKLEGRGVRPRHRGQETPAAVHGHLSGGGEASDGATPKGRARPRSPSRYPPFHHPPLSDSPLSTPRRERTFRNHGFYGPSFPLLLVPNPASDQPPPPG